MRHQTSKHRSASEVILALAVFAAVTIHLSLRAASAGLPTPLSVVTRGYGLPQNSGSTRVSFPIITSKLATGCVGGMIRNLTLDDGVKILRLANYHSGEMFGFDRS